MWCRAWGSSIVFDMPDGYFGIGCYFETEGWWGRHNHVYIANQSHGSLSCANFRAFNQPSFIRFGLFAVFLADNGQGVPATYMSTHSRATCKALLPRLHKALTSFHDLAFYLWAVALGIAIAVTVRSIVHTNHSIGELFAIAVVSLVCCALQFGLGRLIGRHYQTPVSSCQALGQKIRSLPFGWGIRFSIP